MWFANEAGAKVKIAKIEAKTARMLAKAEQTMPWLKNPFGCFALGILMFFVAFAGELALILLKYEDGLPEVITTSLFGAGNAIIGYGGASMHMRMKALAGDKEEDA